MKSLNPWDKGYIPTKPANGYYDQFNNCDNIKNNFDYLTVPQAAILWCGIPREQIDFELKQCKPKGSTNGLQRNTYVHPYIQCVEPRCLLLHQSFDDGKLKMGRDGEKGGYIFGEKDRTEYNGCTAGGVGHIAHDRRTIKISDLKEFIAEYHPDDMPKTLFSDIDINKAKPISHEDYLTLTAKNEALIERNKDLESRLEKAREYYIDQQKIISELQQGTLASDLKAIPHQSYRTMDRVLYALAKLSKLDNSNPYSQNRPSLNAEIHSVLQADNLNLEYEAIGKLLSRVNEVKPPIKK